MPRIHNKTRRPLKVPLPQGKVLRLAPLKSGDVTAKALQHAPLMALVEAGEIEIEGEERGGQFGSSSSGISPATSHDPDRTIRRTGDG